MANPCPACDGEVPPSTGRRPRVWCSEACRVWALRHPGQKRQRSRACAVCSADLDGRSYKAVVCSTECRNVRSGKRQAEQWLARTRTCSFCGDEFHSTSPVTKCCSLGCAQKLRYSKPRSAEELQASLEMNRERYQRKNRRRRALKHGGKSEPYTLGGIAARDGHRCQLCRRTVDMDLRAPHPRSPTIDHVIPISEGGDDVRANVQLAHFGCNSSKGARGSQQLALIG